MKPERIQLGLRSLPEWRLQRTNQVLNRSYLFADFWSAVRFFRQSATMAQRQGLQLDCELLGNSLTLRLPSIAEDKLLDEHLALARGIENSFNGNNGRAPQGVAR